MSCPLDRHSLRCVDSMVSQGIPVMPAGPQQFRHVWGMLQAWEMNGLTWEGARLHLLSAGCA